MRRQIVRGERERPTTIILAQVKDAEGFWGNMGDFPTVEAAHAYARFWHLAHAVNTRVVVGPARKVLAEF